MFTILAKVLFEPGVVHPLDVQATDTVEEVKEKVAELVGVPPGELEVWYDGMVLPGCHAMAAVGEGGEIEVKGSKRMVARAELAARGLPLEGICRDVLENEAMSPQEKSRVVQLYLDALPEGENDVTEPLCAAVRNNLLEVISTLIVHTPNVFTLADLHGRTPLFHAAESGHLEALKTLLACNADANRAAQDGSSPLFVAACRGHSDIVEFLVGLGVEVDQKTKNKWSALHAAAYHGQTDTILKLLQHGADPNTVDAEGMTPIISAAAQDHPSAIALLLSHKALLNAQDNSGRTALSHASAAGHVASVKTLLDHNADIWLPDYLGRSPVEVAREREEELKKQGVVSREYTTIIDMLLAKGRRRP
eukprot:TRINITY_DN14824_c0_g1_i1.p1 TRINITY_DN14824_c0_g1~~TRINITY_DN14824_c0_g1_i1.p1  ORF type:complete len:364 (+),score=40.99 TRINITY_DN14824_c0_g1_i1:84-1175(+)